MQKVKEIVRPRDNGDGRQIRFMRWTDALRAKILELSSTGALRSRLDRDWPVSTSTFHDYDSSTTGYGTYRERAQLLDQRNAIATGIVSRCVENVVSTGIRPQAQTQSERWNRTAEELFRNWAEFGADVRGLGDFYSTLQPLWFREYLVGGDVGIILLDDGSLQTIDGNDIETPPEKGGDDSVVDGVVLDRRGRPMAFHVASEDNGRITYQRIRAQDFVYYPRPLRPNQTRGMTALRPAIDSNLFDLIDGNIEAVVVASQMAAMFGLIIKTEAGAGGTTGLKAVKDSQGNAARELPLEPGTAKWLRAGETVEQVAPLQPSQNYPDFLSMMCRFLGLPFGLPLELILMDFSQTNYSSARASLLQAYRTFQTHQQRFVNLVLRRIYRWRVSKWIKTGELANRKDAWSHTWITPGWPWVDPQKEAIAHLIALDGGWETLTDIALGIGKDFAEIAERRKKELEIQRQAGMPIVRSKSTRDAGSNDNATE